jgi:CRP/FNR family cyclic AMP-dependent transcriptional regulator
LFPSELVEPRFSRVIDADPDLAESLEAGLLPLVRQRVTARRLTLEVGPCTLEDWSTGPGQVNGFLVLDGLLAREIRVIGRTSTELLGPGDVLSAGNDDGLLVPCRVRWKVLLRAELAVLDESFAERIRPWPEIEQALLSRAISRAHSLAVERALSSHKRLEVRIVGLFWHLAERWGHVASDSVIRVSLPLTHRLLGQLVGAERPSVSKALARLSSQGFLTRRGSDWLLRGTMAEQLDVLAADSPDRIGHPGNGRVADSLASRT